MPEEGKDRGFIVKDRRIFKGEKDTEFKEEKKAKEEKIEEKKEAKEEKKREEKKERPKEPIKIDFPMFIASLHQATLINLGLIPEPESGKNKKDLILAQQNIDILSMLQEKTKGNLTEQEKKILDDSLYELRMLFIKVKGI